MAYYDFDGRITIDEVAAQKDITNMQAARSILAEAKVSVDRMAQQASESQGETAIAMLDKANELSKKISNLMQNLDESIAYIRRVIAHYQLLDQQVKAAIAAANLGSGQT